MYSGRFPSLNRLFPSFVRKISNRINVNLNSGIVSGIIEKLPDGNDFYAFRGIPYAKAPVGQGRFQPAEPVSEFHSAVLDCSLERDVCLSKNQFTQKWEGSEDCLHLNVYTPQKRHSNKLLPVMVFIHGGSLKFGSGNSDCYSPEYLLEQHVIVVTINYRLGPLGFIHLPSQGIDGNAGLKDQLMALRWVAKNITHFEGDPDNVTLFGESAGACVTHMHLLSPISTQYFHKAICQSGLSVSDFAVPNDTVGNTRRLAALINPAVTTDADVLETLRNASPKILAELCDRATTEEEVRRGNLVPFRPVVDVGSKESILPIHHATAMQSSDHIPPIPLMVGYNSREGGSFLGHVIKYPELYKHDMQRLIPRTVKVAQNSPEAKRLAEEIERFYFGPEGFLHRKVNECADLLTDYRFAIEHRIAAELHARFQHRSPLYFYRFEYDGMLNRYKKFLPFRIDGAFHADELGYLFNMRMAPKVVSTRSVEARVRRYMCRMWTNFAKYGTPTPAHDESLRFRWDPVPPMTPDSQDSFRLPYLRINAEPEMDMDPDKERIDFWKNIYKTYNGGFGKPYFKS